MREYTCPGCSNRFYSAVIGQYHNCPFCGLSLKDTGLAGREENRDLFLRDCRIIIKGDMAIQAQTTDISRKGVGVIVKGPLPFKRDDTVHVEIRDFDLDSNAKVVWIQTSNVEKNRAGLRFL